jgi:DNA topoisomerase-1
MSNYKNKILVIVESPAKCKKIESLLGSNYICKASFGHIMKLKSVNIDDDFKTTYEKITDGNKGKNTSELKKISKQCSETIIASDLDREGEAIGYNLIEELKLNPKTTKRIIFNEITKASLTKAVANPTIIDMDLYHAQKARSVLDMIVGYELSPLLWKYIKKGLSAGRVQSPGLKILCDREDKISSFESDKFYKVQATFKLSSHTIESNLSDSIENEEKTQKFLEKCAKSKFEIEDVKSSESNRSPPDPFITSTLQQEASKKHGISPKSCMAMAQKLYENGLITYMRTDSVVLSQKALEDIEVYIMEKHGKKYYQKRIHKNKGENTQEAHEAIRPTDVNVISVGDKIDDKMIQKLYTLIWRRTIASQMTPMKVNVNKITISISKESKYKFITTINRIIFDGFSKIYKDEDTEVDTEQNEINIGKIEKGQQLVYKKIIASEDCSKPSPRYTEADLIKDLVKKGIGRPSTFSSIITLIQDRGYAEKKSSNGKKTEITVMSLVNGDIETKQEIKITDVYKNRLAVTEIGKVVNKFLTTNFNNIINYTFTSKLENNLDLVSTGKMEWKKLIREVYEVFSPTVYKLRSVKLSTDEENGKIEKNRRLLGKSTKNDNNIYITHLKNGLVVAESDPTGKKLYSKFASVPSEHEYDTINLDTANDLLKYPYVLGMHEDNEIVVNNGMYGKYMKYNSKNISLTIEQEEDLTVKKALKIIEEDEQRRKDQGSDIIKEFSDAIILKKGKTTKDGKQMSNYILYKNGKTNQFISIPKDIDGAKMTLKEAKEFISLNASKFKSKSTSTYKKKPTKKS